MKTKEPVGKWYVFNRGEPLEFAECSLCEHEQEPAGIPGFMSPRWYPKRCPKCGLWMTGTIRVEDVDAGTAPEW